jgi:predicted membrane protein
MTNVVFGVLAAHLAFDGRTFANRFLIWGVNVGILGFAIGLITTTTALKRAFTPLMGAALLVGIGAYLMQLRSSTQS